MNTDTVQHQERQDNNCILTYIGIFANTLVSILPKITRHVENQYKYKVHVF